MFTVVVLPEVPAVPTFTVFAVAVAVAPLPRPMVVAVVALPKLSVAPEKVLFAVKV
jgi:hypothetical protein